MRKRLFLLFVPLIVFFACEDEGHSVAVFSGVEPIYELGLCDNRVQSVTLYLSVPDTLLLGVDGGDGVYHLANQNESVAQATFVDEVNGYERISILPLQPGNTVLRVVDASGEYAELRISVRRRFEYRLVKEEVSYGITEGYTHLLDRVAAADAGHTLTEQGGCIVMVPDTLLTSTSGVLEIYLSSYEADRASTAADRAITVADGAATVGDEAAIAAAECMPALASDTLPVPVLGQYNMVLGEGEGPGYMWFFTVGGVQHIFHCRSYGPGSNALVLSEDITSLCSAFLPSGVSVIRRELFLAQE